MGGVPTMEEKSKQSSNRGSFGEIIKILLLQVLVLLIANLLYQQVAKVQIELSLSARPAISEKNATKWKEPQNINSPENKKIAWNEPASAEKALRDYTDFVVTKRPWLLVIDRIAWAVCFLFPAFMILRRLGKADCTDFSESFDGGAFGIGISVGFATFCFVNVAGGLIFFFIGKPQSNPLEVALTQNLQGNWFLLFWASLGVSLGAGLVEETFFRGFLLKQFVGKGHEIFGLIFTSLIFGLIHYNPRGSWVGPILLIFVGFYFGLSYLKTGNIWVPITAHVAYNSSMLIAAFFLGDRVVG